VLVGQACDEANLSGIADAGLGDSAGRETIGSLGAYRPVVHWPIERIVSTDYEEF